MARVRVLVVDDHEPFRRAMASVIEASDDFVLAGLAGTGEESLRMVGETDVDLVLMDVNLPGLDGIETTRRLRERDPAPVVVLMSTYAGDTYDYRDSGAAGYVTKAEFGLDRLLDLWTSVAG